MRENELHDEYEQVTIAISRVLAPVVICMVLSVWFVNSLGPNRLGKCISDGSNPLAQKPLPAFSTTPTEAPSSGLLPGSRSFSRMQAIIFVSIFVVLIVVFTYLIVWLYRRGYHRFLATWLFFAVFLIFGYVGGLYLFEFASSRCLAIDWISLVFMVWNFTVTGVVAVFGNVPRVVNQFFLIVMASLMAYIFRTLPEWSTWTILGVLVVWDLFAVLTPFGPLKMLVDYAKKNREQLPALVYDTNPADAGRDPEATPSLMFRSNNDANDASAQPTGRSAEEEHFSDDERKKRRRRRLKLRRRKRDEDDATEREGENDETEANEENVGVAVSPEAQASNEGRGEARTATQAEGKSQPREKKGVGVLGTHLKLGLGDFVFYSVLVGQASVEGAMTTITSFVGVLAGLCITLFLVLIYKKALPALPVSIVFGIVFYFLTKYTVQPFVLNLVPELSFH